MKVSNVSIVKSESFSCAVEKAIGEFFCDEYASECVAGLNVVDGEQGLFTFCTIDDSLNYSTRAVTEYFFCKSMPCGFVKIEHCNDVVWSDK